MLEAPPFYRFAAITLFAVVAQINHPANAQVQVTYPTSEAALSQILNNNRSGVHSQLWADIRADHVNVNGKSYPGFISVHAKGATGGQCRWDFVIEPHTSSNDWFVEKLFSQVQGCTAHEANHVDSVRAYGMREWHRIAVVDNLSKRAPIGDPTARLSGSAVYYPDKVIFVVTKQDVKMKPMPAPTPGQTRRPSPDTYRHLQKR